MHEDSKKIGSTNGILTVYILHTTRRWLVTVVGVASWRSTRLEDIGLNDDDSAEEEACNEYKRRGGRREEN